MKKLLLLLFLFTTPLHAEVYGPEPNWEYNNEEPIPVKKFESPTNNQLWLFWTLNALDVYTTDRAIRKCPDCRELNPLLPNRPNLAELILYKAVFGGVVHYYGNRQFLNVMNTILGGAVIHNYEIVN